MQKEDLLQFEKTELVEMVSDLQLKLERKKTELHKAKTRLSTFKNKMLKMKDTVAFQRKRILELYK
jgi:predicted nuclease with TOPRIM domain